MSQLAAAAGFGTRYEFQHIRNGEVIDTWIADNLIPNEGLNYILNTAYRGTTQVSTWYVGLFSNNHTPAAGDTGSSIDGVSIVEITAYTGNRPAVAFAAASGQAITNSASVAEITLTGGATLRGGFIVQAQTKGTSGAGNGTLISVVNFGADRTLQTADIIKATVSVSAASV